jgi:hypothetical protein
MLGAFAKCAQDKDMEACKKSAMRFMGGLDKRCPSEGFLHGRVIPSIGDVMLYSMVNNGTYGANAQGLDCSAYKNVCRIAEAVGKCLKMGGLSKMMKMQAMKT